jgi:hypothetical protein
MVLFSNKWKLVEKYETKKCTAQEKKYSGQCYHMHRELSSQQFSTHYGSLVFEKQIVSRVINLKKFIYIDGIYCIGQFLRAEKKLVLDNDILEKIPLEE